MRVLTKEQIALNLVGLAMCMALAAWWYWQSTGVQAVPALIEQLHDPDPSTRIVAADWLGDIGPKATAAVPSLLVLATKDSVQHANTTAAAALRHIDLAAARLVMAHYVPFLNVGDIQSRRTAGAVIGELGPVAKPAVPSLIALMHDPDELVRRNVLAALGNIGIPAGEVSNALFAGLRDPSALVRQAAATQLAFAVPLPRERVDEITAMLDQQDAAVSGLLRNALEKTRQGDAARVETFVLMIGQSTGREYALHQLARLGPTAIAAAPILITVLQDDRPMHRYLAVEALSAIGAGGGQTIVALTPLRHDPDPIVRESATDALAAIDSRSPALHNGARESPRMKP